MDKSSTVLGHFFEGADFLGGVDLGEIVQRSKQSGEKKILFVVGIACLNSIWHHRNEVCFQNIKWSLMEVFLKIQREAILWIESRILNIEIDNQLWLLSPRLAYKSL